MEKYIPAVYIFPAEQDLASNDEQNTYGRLSKKATEEWRSAGLYLAEMDRQGQDEAEDGFKLILPYTIGEHGFARKSDSLLDRRVEDLEGCCEELYQHGAKPFGGEWWRAQRLVKLFDNWTGMAEKGLWEVGEDGVLGGIEKFKEADTEEGWKNYWIPPDW